MKLLDGGVFVALIVGLIIGSTVIGRQRELCTQLGGTYTPETAPGEVCPGGRWLNLFKPSAP